MARGLAYLHEESVVHGDLRGANISINDSGEAVVNNIGVVRVALDDSNGTHVTESLKDASALRWMAPELLDPNLENPKLTKETDMYAFAMTAIEVRLLDPVTSYYGWLY